MFRGSERVLTVGWCVLVVLGGLAGTASVASGHADRGISTQMGTGVSANEPPLAEAGLDQTVPTNSTVFLDATGSSDPDGSIAGYEWRIEGPNGNVVRAACPTCARTRFVARQAGQYDVTVTVTDDDGAQRSDTLYVTAAVPDGPEVTLSGPGGVLTNETHTYSASASAGAADLARVLWFVDNQRVAMTDIAGESAAPALSHAFTANGTHSMRVEVVDRLGRRASATRNVTVSAASVNHAPTVSGLDDHTVDSGETLTLTVTTSDIDGDDLTYSWWVENTGEAEFTDETGPEARVTMPTVSSETDYEVVVSVADGDGGRVNTTATVTVEPAEPTTTPGSSGSSSSASGSCVAGLGGNCGDGPPRYKMDSQYDAGWCTMGEQTRGNCQDRQYGYTDDQFMLVDNDADHEITLDMSGTGTTILVGIIPDSSDVAAIFIDIDRYEDVRERAWEATWNEDVSREEAAVTQGETIDRNYD